MRVLVAGAAGVVADEAAGAGVTFAAEALAANTTGVPPFGGVAAVAGAATRTGAGLFTALAVVVPAGAASSDGAGSSGGAGTVEDAVVASVDGMVGGGSGTATGARVLDELGDPLVDAELFGAP